jgi:hypothetical protein
MLERAGNQCRADRSNRGGVARAGDPSARRVPKLDTMPVGRSRLTASQIDERISEALRDHYDEFLSPIIAGVLARALDEGSSELQLAVKELRAEIAALKADLAELRAAHFDEKAAKAEEKSAPVDLPRLPLHHRVHMN